MLRTHHSDFIEPCLPSSADRPSERSWLDSRDQAWRLSPYGAPRPDRHPPVDAERARLAPRYPLIVEAVLIDGEAVACDENGAVFQKAGQRRGAPLSPLRV